MSKIRKVRVSGTTYEIAQFEGLTENSTGTVSLTMEDDTKYELDEVESLALTFPAGVSCRGMIRFGGTVSPTISITGVQDGDIPTSVSNGDVYEFSCEGYFETSYLHWHKWEVE